MAGPAKLSIPTKGPLPDTLRLSSVNGDVYKALSRLPRAALLRLALQWLDDANLASCMPYLTIDESNEEDGSDDAPYLAAQSIEELRETYRELEARKGGKREVVDRILEGDWRHGISLSQLAMADAVYLQERQASQKWHALRLATMRDEDEDEEGRPAQDEPQGLPRFQRQAFIQSLQREVGALAKAHYYVTRDEEKAYTLLRIFFLDLPYNTQRALSTATSSRRSAATESIKSIFVVFPDASPFVYVSVPASASTPAASEGRSLQRMIIDAIPKALSRPQARYELKTTALSAKTLPALLALRGSGRSNAAAGGWSIFVDDVQGHSALACAERPRKRSRSVAEDHKENTGTPDEPVVCAVYTYEAERRAEKRRKAVAAGRFGCSGLEDDGKGIERFDVRIDDAYPKMASETAHVLDQLDKWHAIGGENQQPAGQTNPSKAGRKDRPAPLDTAAVDGVQSADDADSWRPEIRLSFQGSHVFAGIRQLVEKGVVDGERMPGWMTGESGVSTGAVRHGRMVARADGVL